MKTTVNDYSGLRVRYSSLARRAEKMTFLCKKITFAEQAPESNGFALRREGWNCMGSVTLEECTKLKYEELWYKTASLGGAHAVYVRNLK